MAMNHRLTNTLIKGKLLRPGVLLETIPWIMLVCWFMALFGAVQVFGALG